MKQMKFVPADRLYRLAGWLLPVITIMIFSCTKHQNPTPPPSTNMAAIASALEGEVYTGSIETYQEADGIAFVCNEGKTIIALEKLNPDNLPTSGNIEHAEIISSNAGIIVRDITRNEVWVYINNDPESRKEFGKIKSYFTKKPSQSLIYSHIRINDLMS